MISKIYRIWLPNLVNPVNLVHIALALALCSVYTYGILAIVPLSLESPIFLLPG